MTRGAGGIWRNWRFTATIARITTKAMNTSQTRIAAVGSPAARPSTAVAHEPPASFRRGQAVTLAVRLPEGKGVTPLVYYRRVNQAEAYVAQAMDGGGGNGEYRATIPAQYTDSPFPLEYYFELRDGSGKAWMFPGFNREWSNQPYFVIRESRPPAAAEGEIQSQPGSRGSHPFVRAEGPAPPQAFPHGVQFAFLPSLLHNLIPVIR